MPYPQSGGFKSLFGRQFGMNLLTTAAHGGARPLGFLSGEDAEQVRMGVTTAETTALAVTAVGVSWLNGTSAASSSVYVLDPPIPGVFKVVNFSSANTPQYLKTKNGETFRTSADSTIATVISSTLTGCTVQLVGLTTAMWGLLTNGTTAISRAATT